MIFRLHVSFRGSSSGFQTVFYPCAETWWRLPCGLLFRWVARTPTKYDKHQLLLCHVFFDGFLYEMYRKQGWTNPEWKTTTALGQWHCWPFDVHVPGAAWRFKQNDLSQLSWESCLFGGMLEEGGPWANSSSGSQGPPRNVAKVDFHHGSFPARNSPAWWRDHQPPWSLY